MITDSSDYSDDSPFLLASFPSDQAVKEVLLFTFLYCTDMFQSSAHQIGVQIVV